MKTKEEKRLTERNFTIGEFSVSRDGTKNSSGWKD
jgi:hypothetical protein